MVDLILIIVLILACFFGIQKNKSTVIFGKESTVALKGFAALLILFHHIVMNARGGFLNRMIHKMCVLYLRWFSQYYKEIGF